jgi:hypothetical protein
MGAVYGDISSLSVSGLSWYAAVLNWITTTATSVDIYQCVDASYTILSGTKIASNVSNDYGSSSTGSYLLNNLDASRTYYYALTLSGETTKQRTLSVTTLYEPAFGVEGGTNGTSIISYTHTGYGSPVINGENTKMLLYTGPSHPTTRLNILYTSRASTSDQWSTPLPIPGLSLPALISTGSMSYKGDYAMILMDLIYPARTEAIIYIIYWNGNIPSYSKQDLSYCTIVNMTMDGTFALASTRVTGKVYYSKLNLITNQFSTFTDTGLNLGTNTGIVYAGCFNSSGTIYVGTCENKTIKVLNVNTSTSSVTLYATYNVSVMSDGMNSRGLILVGGKTSRGIYLFQNSVKTYYLPFDETSLPVSGSSLPAITTNILNNWPIGDITQVTNSSFINNILYYNNGFNSSGSAIIPLRVGDVPSISSFTASGVSWYAALLNWVSNGTTSVDIYQCVDASYTIGSATNIVTGVRNDYGSTTTGSYLINTLNASTTYYYAITIYNQTTKLKTLSFTTLAQPIFGVGGSTNTSVKNLSNTSMQAPALNGEYSKMLLSSVTNKTLYYSTSSNNGTTWSNPVSYGTFAGTYNFMGCLSYKGDKGVLLDSNGIISSVFWNSTAPSKHPTTQTLTNCQMIAMTLDGSFALASVGSTLYYSKWDFANNRFNTFVDTGTTISNKDFVFGGCFNRSSTMFVGSTPSRITVFSINTATTPPTITNNKSYLTNIPNTVNPRGLILVGGTTITGIYYWTAPTPTTTAVYYSAFNESALPTDGSTLSSFTRALTNFPTSDGNNITISSCGYGNTLYYNSAYNTIDSSINKIAFNGLTAIPIQTDNSVYASFAVPYMSGSTAVTPTSLSVTNGTGIYSYSNGTYDISFSSTYAGDIGSLKYGEPYIYNFGYDVSLNGVGGTGTSQFYNNTGATLNSIPNGYCRFPSTIITASGTISGTSSGAWKQIKLPYLLQLTQLVFTQNTRDVMYYRSFVVYGSNTGIDDWVNLGTCQATQNTAGTSVDPGTVDTYNITPVSPYRYFRFVFITIPFGTNNGQNNQLLAVKQITIKGNASI